MIRGDLAEPKKLLKSFENRHILLMLHHAELGEDLPADLHTGLSIDANKEAPFSIDKSDDPLGAQSFLLVVCTGWIFTLLEYHRILQIFQHIARCTSCHC